MLGSKRRRGGDAVENFYFDYTNTYNGNQPAYVQLNSMFLPPQGTGESERIADAALVQSFQVRGIIQSTPQHYRSKTKPNAFVRILIYVDKTPQDPLPIEQMFLNGQTPSVLSWLDPQYQGTKFITLYDETLKIKPGKPVPTSVQDSILMKEPTSYQKEAIHGTISIPLTKLVWKGKLQESIGVFGGSLTVNSAALSANGSVNATIPSHGISGTVAGAGSVGVVAGEGGPLHWNSGTVPEVPTPWTFTEASTALSNGAFEISTGSIAQHSIVPTAGNPFTIGTRDIQSLEVDPQNFERAAYQETLTAEQYSTWSGGSELFDIQLDEQIMVEFVKKTTTPLRNQLKFLMITDFEPQPLYDNPANYFQAIGFTLASRAIYHQVR